MSTGHGIFMNVFTQELARVVDEYLLEEKWLLTPSLRIGQQWLDVIAFSGRPVVNVRLKTLPHTARDLAQKTMTDRGLAYLPEQAAHILIEEFWVKEIKGNATYLTKLGSSPGFFRAIYSTIRDIRFAGLDSSSIDIKGFEVANKGKEIKAVLEGYSKLLLEEKLVDDADVTRIAVAELKGNPDVLSSKDDVAIIAPEGLYRSVMEEALLEELLKSEGRVITIPVDKPEPGSNESVGGLTDAELLRWVNSPSEAPLAKGDGTANIFNAIGEVNEIREILRRCLARGYPLDEVEILYTDGSTYIPLIYETFQTVGEEDYELGDLPVTFYEGIPTKYSRPGKALMNWVSWLRSGYPQSTLVRMVRDGVLRIPGSDSSGESFSSLARELRAVPIGYSRERYLGVLDQELEAYNLRREGRFGRPEDEDDSVSYHDRESKRYESLRIIKEFVEGLLDVTPTEALGHSEILGKAVSFLEERVRSAGKFDEYARQRLVEEVKGLIFLFERYGAPSSLDVLDWLESLPEEVNVLGRGPLPGHVYVAPVSAGGHSGRQYTFIAGLDDGRFPGRGYQDPLFLDSERENVSGDLPTSSSRLKEKLLEFERTLGRIRGTVTLSYPCYDLIEDSEMFPSPVLLKAYRILTNNPEHTIQDFIAWLRAISPPASFAPLEPESCLNDDERWFHLLCVEGRKFDNEQFLNTFYPHLARGLSASEHRNRDSMTPFDGYVPRAGKDLNPLGPGAVVLSSTRLEMAGACPLRYFFNYVLGISKPEEFEPDFDVWLDPLSSGSLLHSVFRELMVRVTDEKGVPSEPYEELAMGILEKHVQEYKEVYPPVYESLFREQCRQFEQAVLTFLREGEIHGEENQPVYFEAAIGMAQDEGGTPLDYPKLVIIKLPGGAEIKTRAKIDRVDKVLGGAEDVFKVWDYKTGSTYTYTQEPPFWRGRVTQNVLYSKVVESRLRDVFSDKATVGSFVYFFPGVKGKGVKEVLEASDISEGLSIIEKLCETIAAGCFLATNEDKDCTYCDYGEICTGAGNVAEESQSKLENEENDVLQPFRELRSNG